MGLNTALNTALSGLRVNQASIEVVARNISNVDTPGYTRKVADQRALLLGGKTSVLELNSKRIVDEVLQRQIRSELTGVGYTDTRFRYLNDLDSLYGTPGNAFALDSLYNKFLETIEALATSPESFSARAEVVSSAAFFTQRLNNMSSDIQRLRLEAETELQTSVNELDSLLKRLEKIDQDITAKFASGNVTPDMLDVRDQIIDEISMYVDISVTDRGQGGKTLFTTSGRVLYDGSAVNLSFDGRGTVGPESLYSTNPADRNVGTVTLTTGSGFEVDLIANKSIRGGKIGALIQLRDDTLVKAQAQLDEFAAAFASVMMDDMPAPAATPYVDAGDPDFTGLSIDLSGMLPNDSITIEYELAGVPQTLILVRTEGASAVNAANYTNDPAVQVMALDFSQGLTNGLVAVNAALGGDLVLSNTGSTLNIAQDDTDADTALNGVTGTFTSTGLSNGTLGFPLFIDPTAPGGIFTGALNANGNQKTGFSARIQLNPDVLSDPSLLVRYGPGTEEGDGARALDILRRLDLKGVHDFNPAAGIGSNDAPFNGSLSAYLRSHIATQTGLADVAFQAKSAQDAVFDNLRTRFSETSGVNIDQEMAQLLALQNAYGANARVFQTLRELFDLLTRL